jgi:hypothetical protein
LFQRIKILEKPMGESGSGFLAYLLSCLQKITCGVQYKPVFFSGIPVGASVGHSNHQASLLAQTSEQVRVSHFI